MPGRLFFAASALVLSACALGLLVYEISGAQLAEIRRAALPLLVAALLAGGVAVHGWWRDRKRIAGAVAAEAATRERLEAELERTKAEAAERVRAAEARQAETERDAAERVAAAEQAAEERVQAAERGAEERVAAAESDAAEKVRAAEQGAEERVTAAESDAAEKVRAAELGAEERVAAAESDAAEKVRAAEQGADERVQSAEKETERVRAESESRLSSERRSREVVERARRAEQQWAQELRSQVVSLHRERGALADPEDLPGLVLRTALSLVDADKGLLLRRREDSGRLAVVRHLGFEHDPEDSALARSFAERVIKRDETVRENDEAALDAASRGPADEEIDNLVAIPIYVADEFGGAVVLANKEGGFDEYEDDVLLALGDHAGSVLDNARLRGELRQAYLATVQMLGDAITAKDPFLGGHSREVSGYVAAVAERLGVEPRRREELVFGSLLHDIGKIGISERILLKPARLTPEERAIIELHPRIGYRLVSKIPALEPIAAGVLHHHERFDGEGYPSRLRGEQIPIEARIICVADSFSAMTQDRPYRRRMPLEDACAELERCAGTQFDPEVVRIFVEEVRGGPAPWDESDGGPLAAALGDTELALHRNDGEPLLGSGTMAIIDNLTLLYSHRYLYEAAAAEAQRAEVQGDSFAVVLVELTSLAETNEREGHAAGDATIQSAARALQRAASRCAGTACRYSGDRLALIIPSADEQEAGRCTGELLEDWPSGVRTRTSIAAWRAGERGADVIARARAGLAAPAPTVPAAPPPRH